MNEDVAISDKYKEFIEKGFQEIENGDFIVVDPDDIFGRKS